MVVAGHTDVSLIASGRFSTVVGARRVQDGARVVLKLLHLRVPDDLGWRQVAAATVVDGPALTHPHLLPVTETGRVGDGRPWLSMREVTGGSLRRRLALTGSFDPIEAARLGSLVAGGLAALHAQGLHHLDIRPANILMDGDVPVLADAGVARLMTDPRFEGRPDYLDLAHVAPEVLEIRQPSAASDVYALASTVHELVAGAAPYAQHAQDPLPVMITSKFAGTPQPLPVGTPSALTALLGEVLAARPADRPSAHGLAEALAAIAGHRMPADDPPRPDEPAPAASGPAEPTRSWPILVDIPEPLASEPAVPPTPATPPPPVPPPVPPLPPPPPAAPALEEPSVPALPPEAPEAPDTPEVSDVPDVVPPSPASREDPFVARRDESVGAPGPVHGGAASSDHPAITTDEERGLAAMREMAAVTPLHAPPEAPLWLDLHEHLPARRALRWPWAAGAAVLLVTVLIAAASLSRSSAVAPTTGPVAFTSVQDLPEPPQAPVARCPAAAQAPDSVDVGTSSGPPPAEVVLQRTDGGLRVSWDDESAGSANYMVLLSCTAENGADVRAQVVPAGVPSSMVLLVPAAQPACVAVGHYLTDRDGVIVDILFHAPVWHCADAA